MSEQSGGDFLALQAALAGRYSLVRELGRGGMGVVFLARDVALDRAVAIKLLPPEMARDPELRDRFLREARIAAQLSHPNIVPIHLVEERDGLVYFVMALVEGESLGDRVGRAGPLRPAEATKLIQEVAWALAYAHGRGVVHRDIKPDNILLERATGRALVTDFGIARSTAAPALTAHGLILGTLHYMAPEQANPNAPVDGRADLYALGITAFFALTGRLPFHGDSAPALIAAHLLEPAPPLKSLAPGVPARLAEAVEKCLAKDPGARWASGEALAAAVADVPQAPAVPPSVRAFSNAMGAAGAQLTLLVVLAMWADILMPEQAGSMLRLLALITALPLLQVLMAVRPVAIAGYTARDVADMLGGEALASDRYTEYAQRVQSQASERLSRPVWRVILAGFGALMMFGAVAGVIEMIVERRFSWAMAPVIALTSLMGVQFLYLAIGRGTWRERVLRWFEGAPARQARVRRALWGLPPVHWLLALGRIGLGKAAPARPPAVQQPTEVLLARAADELFAALPRADRAALGAVPDVVQRLEAAALRLRERRDALARAIADVGEPHGSSRRAGVAADLATEKSGVERRLAAAVEALENLRLDLLKLRAGVGSNDDLTQAIEAARQVGDDVENALAARAEVKAVLALGLLLAVAAPLAAQADRPFLERGHRALVADRYDEAVAAYRGALQRRSMFAGLDDFIAAVESRARLGSIAPADTHHVRVIYLDSIVTVGPGGGRAARPDVTPGQRAEWRVYFGVLQRIIESFSNGQWTIAVRETTAVSTVAEGTRGRLAGPDYLGLSAYFARTADSVDTYITVSSANSPNFGLARRYPLVDGVLYGPHRGMVELGAHPSFMTLLHEFFHTVEWSAGITPAHGFEPGARQRFAAWTGRSELDYYRWHFAMTLPPARGWRQLDHRTRFALDDRPEQRAARARVAAAYDTIPVARRMEARVLAERGMHEQALGMSPYLPEALAPLVAAYRAQGRPSEADVLEQRLRDARLAASFRTN